MQTEEQTAAPVAFDIGDLASTETADLAIVHPSTGEPTTWVWTLAGPNHPKTIEQANRDSREAMRLSNSRMNAMANRKKWKEPEETVDQVREKNGRFCAERVVGWTPAKINGADYPFSFENAKVLLVNPTYGRIFDQVLRYLQAEDSFTKRSEPN